MFGSTRWVEQALRDRFGGLAAYINVDSAVRANDFVGDVMPGLRGPLSSVLAVVRDPSTGKMLSETAGTFQFPGSSSDAGPFLGLTGTPVAEIGFGRHYPVYHTRADTVEWIQRWGDPGFGRAALLARILALYAGYIASDPVPPYRFTEVSEYSRNALRDLGSRLASAGEWDPHTKGLRDALDSYEKVARRWDGEARRLPGVSRTKARAAGALVERAMAAFGTLPGGGAPTYGHGSVLVGPFAGEGCEAEPFASLASAVRARNFDAVRAAGAVIVRQRPGTAKGFVFLSLEDESGIVQAIVRPDLFREHRSLIVASPGLVVEGMLQTTDGTLSVRADRFWPLPSLPEVPSHDFR